LPVAGSREGLVVANLSSLVFPHQEKSKHTLHHLVTSVDLIKLNKVDSEGDLLNLSRNVLKIAYLRPQRARRSPKFGKVRCQGT
jgi:hypothetical protein